MAKKSLEKVLNALPLAVYFSGASVLAMSVLAVVYANLSVSVLLWALGPR
jgi:hypothetical protein